MTSMLHNRSLHQTGHSKIDLPPSSADSGGFESVRTGPFVIITRGPNLELDVEFGSSVTSNLGSGPDCGSTTSTQPRASSSFEFTSGQHHGSQQGSTSAASLLLSPAGSPPSSSCQPQIDPNLFADELSALLRDSKFCRVCRCGAIKLQCDIDVTNFETA
jgi:hypothetical protein